VRVTARKACLQGQTSMGWETANTHLPGSMPCLFEDRQGSYVMSRICPLWRMLPSFSSAINCNNSVFFKVGPLICPVVAMIRPPLASRDLHANADAPKEPGARPPRGQFFFSRSWLNFFFLVPWSIQDIFHMFLGVPVPRATQCMRGM
jgi:hypothetical protein